MTSSTPPTGRTLPALWRGLVDDAAVFPPGNAPLPDAVDAFVARRSEWFADLASSLVVPDTAVGEIETEGLPLSIVLSRGAGGVPDALMMADTHGQQVAGLEVALRDYDDLAGNARRVCAAVDQARAAGDLDDETPIFVELPNDDPTMGWLAAADVVAENELHLKFRTGGLQADLFPSPDRLASWINASLDRELTFKCTAGLHNAVAHSDDGLPHFGFLNIILATAAAFDGTGSDDVGALLTERNREVLVEMTTHESVARGRRWFTSFGSCSVTEPLDDLLALNLMEI